MEIAAKGKKVKGHALVVLPAHIKQQVADNPMNRNMLLTAAGYFPRAVNNSPGRRSGSNDYTLIYCTEGTGTINLKDKEYELRSNDFIIIPPKTPYRYESSAADPWSIYWVNFKGELAAGLYNRSLLNGRQMVHWVPYDENRIKVFDEICRISEKGYDQREIEKMNFYLLHFITSLVYHEKKEQIERDADAISKSIVFMRNNIGQKYEVKELAAQQGLPPAYYSARFKKETGMSPIKYFNKLKIQKAAGYLSFDNRNIKSICADLGFDDQYYFSRLFTQINGLSPSKYRQKFRKHNDIA
ncbi:AraC family transcriptional regulator [Mucilaginibacter kameinonensis]|uniref:AraC family transcriptional regulator n=1 Tax=Mucilaginibacter kameinonensis TaxID=452286 RepID=UPI000EF828E0|nr:AraC family transcriptional regulator [Mucilaginibacter kameinonensis]